MQEACRKSCEFCNASKDAFPDGKEPPREDTAAHACPDGSDLGGGEVLVKSNDPKKIASEEGLISDDDAPLQPSSPTLSARNDHAAVRVGNGAEAAIPVDKARTLDSTGPMGGCARDERLLLDTALASWPLLLINGLLLVLVGYLLRGYTDRRARMRKRRVGSTT